MANAIYVTIAAGSTVSSAFTLGSTGRAGFAIEVDSIAPASTIGIDFSPTPEAGPWRPLMRMEQGVPVTVFSGTGPAYAILEHHPTPYGRLTATVALTGTTSFTILPVL